MFNCARMQPIQCAQKSSSRWSRGHAENDIVTAWLILKAASVVIRAVRANAVEHVSLPGTTVDGWLTREQVRLDARQEARYELLQPIRIFAGLIMIPGHSKGYIKQAIHFFGAAQTCGNSLPQLRRLVS
jgi:hypothetical protein